MRFFEDGPDIPDTLIEARDLGEVVFFCGAGISQPAGLPTFGGLADKLIKRLVAQDSRVARQRGETLDRVFTALVKEFGGAAVDGEITRALRSPRGANLRYHQAIIDLSRGPDGLPKIVTTNFDLLFERADRSLRFAVPPALPDLAQLQPMHGVVYLHGRLNAATNTRSGYVISSADFGRAYLAEGWAARFVRELRERYTIVLLGYSASDPPMRYLLEGLNSREGSAYRSPIYAFASAGGNAEDEEWRDKGITTIPYEARDEAHGGLWDTLFAWSAASTDPEGWRSKLVQLAQRLPMELRPFERRQIAHLVSTAVGASAFAAARPLPAADWLCVLDANVRYSNPGRIKWDDPEEIDPLDVFGLDNDPPRPEPRPGGGVEAPGEDLIRWRRGDQSWAERQRLSGFHADWTNPLPLRLYHLARWFAEIMDQPTAIWWASNNSLPHPGLSREIRRRLDGEELPAPAGHFWRCYVDAAKARAEDLHVLRQYELQQRVQREGWSRSVLRELERVFEPAFEISRAILTAPIPPQGGWDDVRLRDVSEIKVRVAPWPEGLEVPPDLLQTVVALLRRSLERMTDLLQESTSIPLRSPTLHPTGEPGESIYHGRKSSQFLKFKTLFVNLVEHDRDAARRELLAWDHTSTPYFTKLFLYAATLPELVSGSEVALSLFSMSDTVFWGQDHQRELLFALRSNWEAFTERDRLRLERRITAGPPRYEQETRSDYRRRRSIDAARRLRWLELNGLTLSSNTRSKLPHLLAADERWSDTWAEAADDSPGPWGGTIQRITEPQGLETVALKEVLGLAENLSVDDLRQLRDYRPFDGLVEKAPLHALAALRLAARDGHFPRRFWHSLINNWPSTAAPRLSCLLGHVLSRLPEETFIDLRHGIATWAVSSVPSVIRNHSRRGFAVFDGIVDRYLQAPPSTLDSAVGFSSIGGVVQEKSQVSVMKAINSPGGNLARLLLEMLNPRRRRGAIPTQIGVRLKRLLTLPGDGAGHAACVIARQLSWFEYWHPEWTLELLPLFNLSDPLSEGMWHGLVADRHLLTDASLRSIKPALVALLKGEAPWELDRDAREQLMHWLPPLTRGRQGEPAIIRYAEARQVLTACSDTDRAETLGALARSMNQAHAWDTIIKPFLLQAWPRQLRYQSEASARQLANIAENAGDKFPEVLSTIKPYLRPIQRLDIYAYQLRKQDEGGHSYSARFPVETLTLLGMLIGDDPQTAPWGLGEILEDIASASPALRQNDGWRRLKALSS